MGAVWREGKGGERMFFTVTEINLLKRKAGGVYGGESPGEGKTAGDIQRMCVCVCIDRSNLITVRSTENARLPYRALQWFVARPVSSILHRAVNLVLLLFFACTGLV